MTFLKKHNQFAKKATKYNESSIKLYKILEYGTRLGLDGQIECHKMSS